MKKTSVLKSVVAAFAASTLFACTQDVTDSLPVQTESDASVTKELPKYRTYEEALAVAQDAIGLLGESSTTRSGKPRTVNTSDVQYILNSSATRSDDEPDTLMYVFNYEDNAGFAVVSANRATEELIAVTEQGNYVAGEETGNKGFELYMDMAEDYLKAAVLPPSIDDEDDGEEDNGPVDMCELVRITQKCILCSYGPFVTTRWGQGAPYNQYCITNDGDTIDAGCLITAVAQIFSYYEHPTQIDINYEGGSSILPLNWSEIKKHMGGFPYGCTCTEHETISRLFRQLGYRLQAIYWEEESGGNPGFLNETLRLSGYNHDGDWQSYSSSVVEASLSQCQLVCIRGSRQTEGSGHAWVIDGFKRMETVEIEYSRNTVTGEMIELWRDIPRIKSYNHFNWGWDGDSNGYYLCDVFDARRYDQLDPGVSSTAPYYYTDNIKIYPYITH